MSASNFHLRDIPTEVMHQLKQEAKRLKISVNSLVLKMIERGLGFTFEKPVYHDLDYLSNSWSPAEEQAFLENIQFFENFDKALWK